ncbi:MAG: tandem-95 repeat protein [Fidelibacterota bacterium]|nr:MAG: tandem-95 repeat protein [Candidatus Neomarinimicrobiota bacterium]
MRSNLTLGKTVVVGWIAHTLSWGQPQPLPASSFTLQDLSQELQQRYRTTQLQVKQTAVAHRLALHLLLSDGRRAALQRFSHGHPLYYITTNLIAARTVGTDRVWPGGELGLNLIGSDELIGIWDDGGVLSTHQEFGDRVTLMDAAINMSSHATHVAGTIVAAGLVPEAHGMASAGNLHSYDWELDGLEMTIAASNGLALSNHSYSYVRGWQWNWFDDNLWVWFGDESISTTDDYRFGFYDSTAREWDQIATAAPKYLIVTSAGNDRTDNGPSAPNTAHWVWDNSNGAWILSTQFRNPDGPYDCLPGGAQVAKNMLVVGAVEDIPGGYTNPSDVVMTPFSSWGPTDDGRIKPDIVANGSQLYSTVAVSDTGYGTMSGTSMAAPTVTGSIALLRQHYRATHDGELPLAATLRALVIHSADEAGEGFGPDYSYGWGLLNTGGAVKLISEDNQEHKSIQELILNSGDDYSLSVMSEGLDALKVTIAWTDPPGNVPPAELDPRAPILVNDLDLRVIRASDAYVFPPWRLTADFPDQAAIIADNDIDNVEQVLIDLPIPGEYLITVAHKGSLAGGSQSFSMIISGATFPALPDILAWEGDSTKVDYSGSFIRETLPLVGEVDLTYSTVFPMTLDAYDAVFLSFGPPVNRTVLNDTMAIIIQTYLEQGGSLYLEGGDALGVDLAGNDTLLALLGIETVVDGSFNPIDGLEGQPQTLASGMSFSSSTQIHNEYPDIYYPGTGTTAFIESNYGTVAAQHSGDYGQRTFVFSYALAELVDGVSPSTRSDLLAGLFDFFLTESQPSPNSPPLAVDDTVNMKEDSTASIPVLANDYDPDNDQLSISSYTQGMHGQVSVSPSDTTVIYAPEPDFFGADSFTYELADGRGGFDSAIVRVTVEGQNDDPVALDDEAITLEDMAVLISVLSNDVDIDGDTLSVISTESGENGLVSIAAGDTAVVYTPEKDFNGSDTFAYVVGDNNGGYDSAVVTVIITAINDSMDARDDTVSTPEDTPVSIHVLANDIDRDGDSLIVVNAGPALHGGVTFSSDGLVTYSPELNYFGPDTFPYFITDNIDGIDTARVYVTVTPVNDPPLAADDEVTTAEDSVALFAALKNDYDPDGDWLSLADTTWHAGHGEVGMLVLDTAGVEGIVFSYLAEPDFFGRDSFSYRICDGILLDTASVTIDVFPVNDSPGPFALLEPGPDTSNIAIIAENIGDSLIFSWEPSHDVDGDSVSYRFESHDTLSTLLPAGSITRTRVTMAYSDLATQLRTMGITGRLSGHWTVLATDGTDTTRAHNGPFRLAVDMSSLQIASVDDIPREYSLYQNFPNPFNPNTIFRFALPKAVKVRLAVFDLKGREVNRIVDGVLPAGYHQVLWDGRMSGGKEVPSGVYFAVMTAPGFVQQIKMAILR